MVDEINIDVYSITGDNIQWIRSLRNICASSDFDTNVYSSNGTVLYIFTILKEIAVRKLSRALHSTNDALKEAESNFNSDQDLNLPRFAEGCCQFLSNYATGLDENCAYLCSLTEDHWQDAIAACSSVKSRKGLAALITTLYQCIHPKFENYYTRVDLLLTYRAMLCQLLLETADIRLANESSSFNQALPSDPALEWLHIFSFHLVKSGSMHILYDLVGPSTAPYEGCIAGDHSEDTVDKKILTHEQVCHYLHATYIIRRILTCDIHITYIHIGYLTACHTKRIRRPDVCQPAHRHQSLSHQ